MPDDGLMRRTGLLLPPLEAWTPPPGWTAPHWLPDEPEQAQLPMGAARLRWCLAALGWSQEELSRRIHTHSTSVHQMARGTRDIPDTLAIWLEGLVAHMLMAPALPDGWRPKAPRTE